MKLNSSANTTLKYGKIVFCLLAICSLCSALEPAMEAYYAANALYNKKLYDLAAEEYKAFMLKYPNHEKILSVKLGLALSYYEMENYSESEPILAELASNRRSPQLELVHNLWGQCLLIAGRPRDAETAFRWSVNRGKERFFLELPGISEKYQESPKISVASTQDLEPLERSLAGLVEALFQQKKWKETASTGAELLKLVPSGVYSTRVSFLTALSNYELEEYSSAKTILEKLVQDEKAGAFKEHSFFLLAECRRELGELESAAQTHAVVARELKGSFTGNALFRLGFIRFQQKKYALGVKAFSDLRAVYTNSPYFSDAGVYLGRCFLEMGKFSEAQSVFGMLTDDPKVNAEASLWLGKTFMRQKFFDKALAVFEPAVEKFKGQSLYPNLLFDYANSLLGADWFDDAAEVFGTVLDVDSEEKFQADALRLRAFCLNRAGKWEKSLKACLRFLREFPQDPSVMETAFLKAENLFFLDRFEDASKAYRQFIPWKEEGPYTKEARFRIVQCLCRLGSWDEAIKEMEPLIKNPPEKDFFEQLFYMAGLAAFNTEKWDKSVIFFNRFVNNHPGGANADTAVVKSARAYEVLGQKDSATQSLRSLISSYPQSSHVPLALAELGRLLYDAGKYKEAAASLQSVLRNHPDSSVVPQAEYYLGWTMLSVGNKDEAIQHFTNVTQRFADHSLAPDAAYQKSLLYIELNDYETAERSLRAFLDKHPKNKKSMEAIFYYGISLARQKKFRQSISVFHEFLKKNPSSEFAPRAWYELAWAYRETSEPEKAMEAYKSLIAAFPIHEMTNRSIFELAEVQYEQKDYNTAIANLDKLLSKGVEGNLLEKVLYRQGWCLLGREQNVLAAEAFEQMIRRFPKSEYLATAAYQSGEVRLNKKEYETAYQHYKMTVENKLNDEIHEQALLRLGETATLTERWKEAEGCFQTFMQTYPDSRFNRRAWMWAGWAKENLKKFDEAILMYRKVIADGHRDELAARSQFQIGECFFAKKNYDQAVKELIKVDLNYSYPSWSAKALLEIGQSLDSKGQADKAVERFKEVIRKHPGTNEAAVAEELLRERKVYSSGP